MSGRAGRAGAGGAGGPGHPAGEPGGRLSASGETSKRRMSCELTFLRHH